MSAPASHDERGSALVIAILVAAILALLGISFLMIGATENLIADNQGLKAQALYAAEAGVRAAAHWFDAPRSALGFPTAAVVDRSLRRIDLDGPGPDPEQVATGTPLLPFYKQGIDANADGADDLFEKPYRGTPEQALLGTHDGPDMRIDADASTASRTFLESFSELLLGDPPTAPRAARITRIQLYAPPYFRQGGRWLRYGMGTVEVTAQIYETATGRSIAKRVARAVLNEVPYSQAYGPLQSCRGLTYLDPSGLHWGSVTAMGTASIVLANVPHSVPRGIPGVPRVDSIWSPGFTAAFADYKAQVEGTPGTTIADPWLRMLSQGGVGQTDPTAPWKSWLPPAPAPGPADDDSNVFQNQTALSCPDFDYAIWKRIAQSGERGARYFTDAGSGRFQENGTGGSQTFEAITHGQEGLFFFDTNDGQAPRDADSNGVFDNLTTPGIRVSGQAWSFRGMLYLNAVSFQADAVTGSPAQLVPPGEPFQDTDFDGRYDAGEVWLNLAYPAALGTPFPIQPGGTHDDRGDPIDSTVSLAGILYTSGTFEAKGVARHYGSVIARSGVTQTSGVAGAPEIYWDATIPGRWPPPGWALPRVYVSSWISEQ
ncbi:MAG TPA: hypothetical protein VJS92_16360 [Candidatus Polarisedimenticolaceae bacterium]|nr:hypothetical protein [Candidatus Polarisedimenticolaceae bacterium]